MLSVILIGISLSMDAFAVSVTNGIAMRPFKTGYALWHGLYFGAFQFLMPLAGYISRQHGVRLCHGHRPVRELCAARVHRRQNDPRSRARRRGGLRRHGGALPQAAARARRGNEHRRARRRRELRVLAPGPGVVLSCAVIGCTTFLIAFGGAMAASRIPGIRPKTAEIAGGIILVGIGVKLLLEGLPK